ncbi:MAG: TerC family protein, partial [Actinomycetota bacterium]|nr:TerC family protein [Actinomycetota bacterium]
AVIAQIVALDAVFSLDSVITAVGMADEVGVMIAAVIVAVGVMLLSARIISEFVNRHPTVKMLALSFLLLIGMALVAEGFDVHIPKGYIYFAMGFSIFVEALNLRMRGRKAEPIELRPTFIKDAEAAGAVGHVPAAAGRWRGARPASSPVGDGARPPSPLPPAGTDGEGDNLGP